MPDGGPAFPAIVIEPFEESPDAWRNAQATKGMSLRDWFSGMALQGIMTGVCGTFRDGTFSAYAKGSCNAVMAERAYVVADAMIAQRKLEGRHG